MKAASPLMLVLAACTPAPDNIDPPADTEASLPAAQDDSAATIPRPGELRTFRDWTVGCDNIGNCKAVALAPEGDAGEWPQFLPAIARDAGAAGALRVSFSGEGETVPPIVVRVDGREVARGGSSDGFEGADAARIAAAMVNGTRAEIESGGTRALVSLAGASAALRFIDAGQGRAGTVGALVAKGTAAENAAPRAEPVVRAMPPSGEPARLDAAGVARLQRQAGCELIEGAPQTDPQFHALGGGVTLALVPCGLGAYNAIGAAFLVEGGKPRPAPFDAPPNGFGEATGAPTLINADFKEGALTTFAKGRGLGDCGVSQRYVWDGTMLRLTEQSEMDECRGSIDYITTWRARVER